MRTLLSLPFLALAVLPAKAQGTVPDSTGLPGDHFSLEGALDLFKQAKDLESFEKALNTADGKVNNLDLDGNGEVDYIRVVDHSEQDAHAIVLQVPLGKEEVQDVAVIELERTDERTAMVQIRGAEELYGPDVMVEPYQEEEKEGKGPRGPAAPVDGPYMRVWVNVWAWPCVTWIYGPTFVVWHSPWYWGYYPPWWRPWRPHPYHTYWGWHRHYHAWYHPVHTCRVVHAHALYQPRAMYSPRVRTATASVRAQRAATRQQMRPDGRTLDRSKDTPDGRRPAVNDPQNKGTGTTRPTGQDVRKGGAGKEKPAVRPERPRTERAPRSRGTQRKAPAPRTPRKTRR